MAVQVRDGRRVAATVVLSLMLGAVATGGAMLMAQDNSGTAPAAAPHEHMQGGDMQGGPHHGGEHGKGDPGRRMEMMTKRLDLTPDQVTQVKAIEADAMTQMKAMHTDTTMSPEDRHTKMKGLHEATMAKVRAVLNDEQKTKFDAMQAHHADHMKHGDGEMPPPPPPA